ncbi:MAG: sulfatase-like hydrolase/transferase [Acidobacteria bacterium]|nr:sulfatase-like hydrolase/transferase [Acidobacteriota bacterium]
MFLLIFLILVPREADGLLATPSSASSGRPNIVLIFCDDLGYSDLGVYGNRIIQTPNLDRLAAQGTRLTQFYMTSPVCTPSRAALMTGHYPQRYGIHHADLPEVLPRYPLPDSAVTIAELLQQAGYSTIHIGKWHLGEPPETVEPRKHGFDRFFGSFGGRPSSPWMKYARSMDPEMIVNEDRPVIYKGHVTEIQTTAALEALAKADRSRPFFLNLWYNAPHEPLAPLADQDRLYKDWSAEEQTYFQTVTGIDVGVGKILAKLEEMGVTGKTLILFSSDNGPESHAHPFSRGSAWPLKGMKTQLWEGGVRVPMILRWPGKIPSAWTSDAITSVLDIFPTLCVAAGVSIPKEPGLDDGQDLVSIIQGKTSTSERPLFFEFHFPQRGVASSLPMAVRKGKWKLFADHEFKQVELYDLESDVGEQLNVASQRPDEVRELKTILRHWWKQFRDQTNLKPTRQRMPVPSPEELDKKYYRN